MIGATARALATLTGLTLVERAIRRQWAARQLAPYRRRVAELELACTDHPLDRALLDAARAHLAELECTATYSPSRRPRVE